MTRGAKLQLRLYVAGNTQNSALAAANLNALCRAHLPGRYDIEIVDVFREPERALADGILMTPTLIKLAPLPARKRPTPDHRRTTATHTPAPKRP